MTVIDFPEPVIASPEALADWRDATDPDLCTCGHNGLAVAWHINDCPIKPEWRPDPRPSPFDAPTVYETAEDDDLSPLIQLGEN